MSGDRRRCLYEVLYVIILAEFLVILVVFPVAFTNRDPAFEDGDVKAVEKDKRMKDILGFKFASNFVEPVDLKKNFLTCREIDQMKIGDPLGRGTTKSVFKSTFAGNKVAVKMVTDKVKDIIACKRIKGRHHLDSCYQFANYKIVKEIALLQQLEHPNIAKLLGYCIHRDEGTIPVESVVMVTERGGTVDIRRMPWPKKLQTSLELAELLHFLHTSPLGSVRIGDFKRDQFRLINNTLKLSDLDDLTADNRTCKTDKDCHILDANYGVHCVQAVCEGFNTAANVKVATKLFFSGIFSKAPQLVKKEADDLLKDLTNTNLETGELRRRIKFIQKICSNATVTDS